MLIFIEGCIFQEFPQSRIVKYRERNKLLLAKKRYINLKILNETEFGETVKILLEIIIYRD
jgi:hypothetical protein